MFLSFSFECFFVSCMVKHGRAVVHVHLSGRPRSFLWTVSVSAHLDLLLSSHTVTISLCLPRDTQQHGSRGDGHRYVSARLVMLVPWGLAFRMPPFHRLHCTYESSVISCHSLLMSRRASRIRSTRETINICAFANTSLWGGSTQLDIFK